MSCASSLSWICILSIVTGPTYYLIVALFLPLLCLLEPLVHPIFLSNSIFLSIGRSINSYLPLLWFLIVIEGLLFITYFSFLFHNANYCRYPLQPHLQLHSMLYWITGLILSLVATFSSINLFIVFILLSSWEYTMGLDTVFLADNPITTIQLSILTLHLLHLIFGVILLSYDFLYPHYFHFVEILWVLIGIVTYIN